MRAINILSSDLPEISRFTKECINHGQALLFKASKEDVKDTYFILKDGADFYALGDKGQVVSMYRPLKQDMVIDEIVYFSDIDKPSSLSNFHLSMKA